MTAGAAAWAYTQDTVRQAQSHWERSFAGWRARSMVEDRGFTWRPQTLLYPGITDTQGLKRGLDIRRSRGLCSRGLLEVVRLYSCLGGRKARPPLPEKF